MKLKFKLKSNRRGAGFLGVCALDSAGRSRLRFGKLRPKESLSPHQFQKSAPYGAFFLERMHLPDTDE